MKKAFLLFLFLCSAKAFAQAPAIQWQKCLGGSGYDQAFSIQQTSDSGYIVAGASNSNDGDVSVNHGGYDYWVLKLNNAGAIQWQKSLGGSSDDYAYAIRQTSDNGYIVAGVSHSNDGDVSGNHGFGDYWVVKLDDTGAIQWQKCLGGDTTDEAYAIQQTMDGGYIVAGESCSNNGEVSGNHGDEDYWVVKLNDTGAIQWQKSLGGSNGDYAYAIRQTSDSGYIIAGASQSNDSNVSGNHGFGDYWVVKLNNLGAIQWQECLGGSAYDEASSIQQTSDGGYIVAGTSNSIDGDVLGIHGGEDYWVVKLNDTGAIQWGESLGGSDFEWNPVIQQTSDGGYIVAGSSNSNDDEVSGNHGGWDYWVVRLNNTGAIQWQESLGGSSNEYAESVQQTSDGGYIIAGQSNSNDSEVSGNHGAYDYWMVKLFAPFVSGVPITTNVPTVTIIPNPTTGVVFVRGADHVNIKVYNTMGQLIKEAGNANDISIAAFPAGMYFVRVFDELGGLVKEGEVVKE